MIFFRQSGWRNNAHFLKGGFPGGGLGESIKWQLDASLTGVNTSPEERGRYFLAVHSATFLVSLGSRGARGRILHAG